MHTCVRKAVPAANTSSLVLMSIYLCTIKVICDLISSYCLEKNKSLNYYKQCSNILALVIIRYK